MPPKTNPNSENLAKAIRRRREQLGMSIEDAAKRAGVGLKTWSRYEAGSAIRQDKVKGVCRALAWPSLRDRACGVESEDGADSEYQWIDSIDESDEAWSSWLATSYGREAAVSFALGSAFLGDCMKDDLAALSKMPRGAHLGEMGYSMLIDLLPAQFVMSYDYDFLFHLRTVLSKYIVRAKSGYEMYAHSVAEELVVRLIRDLSFDVVEEWMENRGEPHEGDEGNSFAEAWGEWPEDLCDDVDFETYLNDSSWLEKGHTYHFDGWFTPQFYLQRDSGQAVDSCACAS